MEVRRIVHRGLNQADGHALLASFIQDLLRREKNITKGLALFGNHPVLVDKQDKIDDFKENLVDSRFWLLRESANVPNFLVIDRLQYNIDTKKLEMSSTRLACTLAGWMFVSSKDTPLTITGCLEMNADLAENNYRDGLLHFLSNYKYYPDMMLVPDVKNIKNMPGYSY